METLNKKILRISECEGILRKGRRGSYDGYKIELEGNEAIFVAIDARQQCCESFGYFSCPESIQDIKKFEGAVLNELVLCGPEKTEAFRSVEKSLEIENCYFVTFKTDKGGFQLSVYNDHNGYYGHDVIVFSRISVSRPSSTMTPQDMKIGFAPVTDMSLTVP